uniref:Uncharacterized protein n=1 Tax=Nelumbo nucifera TaxID=4432 RepID=A0A822Z0Q1_NELNU|nr:TPA_asm: hypothetical protein HUJ06_012884 [Nelumbo nucifera]
MFVDIFGLMSLKSHNERLYFFIRKKEQLAEQPTNKTRKHHSVHTPRNEINVRSLQQQSHKHHILHFFS